MELGTASNDPIPPNFNPNRKADPMLQGKTIIVTGAASGISAATAALVSSHGAEMISVGINVPGTPVGRFMQANLADRSSIGRLVAALPSGGLARYSHSIQLQTQRSTERGVSRVEDASASWKSGHIASYPHIYLQKTSVSMNLSEIKRDPEQSKTPRRH